MSAGGDRRGDRVAPRGRGRPSRLSAAGRWAERVDPEAVPMFIAELDEHWCITALDK
jgi:hypothetical protein